MPEAVTVPENPGDQVAFPLASLVRISPAHWVPLAKRNDPETVRLAVGELVPIPIRPLVLFQKRLLD